MSAKPFRNREGQEPPDRDTGLTGGSWRNVWPEEYPGQLRRLGPDAHFSTRLRHRDIERESPSVGYEQKHRCRRLHRVLLPEFVETRWRWRS